MEEERVREVEESSCCSGSTSRKKNSPRWPRENIDRSFLEPSLLLKRGGNLPRGRWGGRRRQSEGSSSPVGFPSASPPSSDFRQGDPSQNTKLEIVLLNLSLLQARKKEKKKRNRDLQSEGEEALSSSRPQLRLSFPSTSSIFPKKKTMSTGAALPPGWTEQW